MSKLSAHRSSVQKCANLMNLVEIPSQNQYINGDQGVTEASAIII